MKVLIIILTIAVFLQTTILPFDLVMLVLVLRAYLDSSKSNLYLAFFFGLLISHLNATPLGLQSVVYILLVQAASFLGKLPVASNILTVILLAVFSSTFNSIAVCLITGSSLQLFPKVLIESMIALPLYLVVRFWEERFTVKPEIRLKI